MFFKCQFYPSNKHKENVTKMIRNEESLYFKQCQWNKTWFATKTTAND
jgi:hypothetical protein